MPRYYFHLRYGDEFVRDDHGDELADDQLALERAVEAARALLRGVPHDVVIWSECVLEVSDDTGEAVWRLPVLDAVQTLGE